MWPGYTGVMVRRPREHDCGDEAVPPVEAVAGLFGLLPHWAKDAKLARNTFNARSETVHEKPSFRDAWRSHQHCIIAADAIFEPDWRSGKAVATRIARADGEPMGIAGLWSSWQSPKGQIVHSFTMLTINADDHALMRNLHKPDRGKAHGGDTATGCARRLAGRPGAPGYGPAPALSSRRAGGYQLSE